MPPKKNAEAEEETGTNPREASIIREAMPSKELLKENDISTITFNGLSPVPVFDLWDGKIFEAKTGEEEEDPESVPAINWGTAENKYTDYGNTPIILPKEEPEEEQQQTEQGGGEENANNNNNNQSVVINWKRIDDSELNGMPYWSAKMDAPTLAVVENPEETVKEGEEDTNNNMEGEEEEGTTNNGESEKTFVIVRNNNNNITEVANSSEEEMEEGAEKKTNTRFSIPQKLDANIANVDDEGNFVRLTRQAKMMESVFYMVNSMSALAKEKVERILKDEEDAKNEKLAEEKRDEEMQNVVEEETKEEPSEEEIAAKKAEEAAAKKRKEEMISDMDIIPKGTFLWESIYPKGEDGLPKYNPGGRYSVRLFVNGAWRRVDVDDTMPVASESGAPLYCRSSDNKELWPLILSKALSIVVRGNWEQYDALKLLHHLTGLIGLQQDINSDNIGWPLLINAIPHTKIEYEDENVESPRSPRLFDDDDDDDEMEAQMAAQKLEEEAALALAGPEEPTEEEAEEEAKVDLIEQKPNAMYVLIGHNNANVEIDIAEDAGDERNEDVPDEDDIIYPSINARCGYVCMETRGGDDDANIAGLISDDPEIVAAAQAAIAAAKGDEDDDDFSDDREVRLCTGLKDNGKLENGWMNIGQVAKEFSRRTYMIIDINDPKFFPKRKEISKHWQWSWEEKKAEVQNGEEDTEGQGGDAEVVEGEIASMTNVTVPETPGFWSPRSTEWLDTQYLYFSKKKEPTTVEDGEEAPTTEEENAKTEGNDNNLLPYMRVWVMLSADHVSSATKSSSISIRKWSKDFKVGPIALQLNTSTITSGYFDLPSAISEEGEIYEVVSTTVLGCHINISCKCQVEKYTFQTLNSEILQSTVKTIAGRSENVVFPNSWSILKRCTFSAAGAPPVGEDDGEKNTSTEDKDLNLSCHIWCKNPFLKRFLTLYTMNNDTKEITRCPLLKFNNSRFSINEAGYTVYLVCQSGTQPLPTFNWELSLISKGELMEFSEVPINSIQDFESQYIPNKYYRLLRDVVDVIPGEDESTNTIVGSMRLTMSDPAAYAMVRIINPITSETIIEKSGRGFVNLLDVPLTSAPVEAGSEEENEYNGKVIVESVLLPSLFYIDDKLKSRRPYHYPSGQPGDETASDFTWNLRVICGGNGVGLNRDLTQEKADASIRAAWEEAQEGRAILSKATRSYFLFTTQQQQQNINNNNNTNGSNDNDGKKEDEVKTEESVVVVDGLDGLDEEQQEMEKTRRARLAQAVNERPQLSVPVVMDLNKTTKPSVLKEDKVASMRTAWEEKSAASKDLLQIMYQNVETRKAAYEKYKTERLEDLKNNSIDKYAADIDSIYKSYAVEEDKEVAVEEGDKA